MKFDERTIHSIADLINNLKEDASKTSEPLWFRGHAKSDWELKPTLYRKQTHNEINLLRMFKQDASYLVTPRPFYSYDWLFIMRHHGVPTRLLDWTESPLVAAYFAVNEFNENDGAIWVMLPLELNRIGRILRDPNHLPSFDEDKHMHSYRPENYEEEICTFISYGFYSTKEYPKNGITDECIYNIPQTY